jgi:alpha-beta hydrolase superfamily lysophospholipase
VLEFAFTLALWLGDAGQAAAHDRREITFPSEDGLVITADLYLAHKDAKTPFIVLFHRAGWSRGEYREIAPRLNRLGWNCLAVDQRSGGEINGVVNRTAERARKQKKGERYIDALPDLRASLAFARREYAEGPLLALGSSYSAALVVLLAGESPDLFDGGLAFSPGDYFAKQGKPKDWVARAAGKIAKPMFITSAKKERDTWAAIFAAIPAQTKRSYVPETDGEHGARVLWAKQKDSSGYWKAVEEFLNRFSSTASPP